MKIENEWELVAREERVRRTASSRPRRPANTMHEQLRLRWEIEIDHVVEEGKIDAAGSHVRNEHEPRVPRTEFRHLNFPCRLVHCTVDDAAFVALCAHQREHQLRSVFGGCEHDGLLRRRHDPLHEKQERTELLLLPHLQETHLQHRAHSRVRVQPHELGIPQTCAGELREALGQRRAEEHRLPAARAGTSSAASTDAR